MKGFVRFFMVFVFTLSLAVSASAADSSMARIIGGVPADNGEFPFMVAIGSEHPANSYTLFCGGAIISDRWVVTAAHCVEAYDTSAEVATLFVVHGTNSVNPLVSGNMVGVSQIIVHENFHDGVYYNNDVALLQLSSSISTEPIDHISTSMNPYYTTGTTATVAGWGDTDIGPEESYPDNLRKVDVPVVAYSTCQSTYGSDLTTNMICAGYAAGGYDSCQGDSGGPLFVKNSDNSFSLIGIVSFGTGCAQPDYYGVYTKVENYTDWIESKTGLSFSNPDISDMIAAIELNSSYDVDTSVMGEVRDSFSDGGTVGTTVTVFGGEIESLNVSESATLVDTVKNNTQGKIEMVIDTDGDKDIAVALQYSNRDADTYTIFKCPVFITDQISPLCEEAENVVYNSSGDWLLFYIENNDGYYDGQLSVAGLGDDKIESTIVLARSTTADDLWDAATGGGGGCSAAGKGSAFSFALMLGFCGAFVLRRRFIKVK